MTTTDTEPAAGAFRAVGPASELHEGSVNPYYLEDLKRRVSVVRVGGALHAFDDLSAAGCPLSAGLLTGTTIMCQCDGSQYDVTTGAVLRGPAVEPLRTYPVREQDGQIEIQV
jgi:nitrite reductase/ring-hydroxylating ferredoxin subunit